MFFVCHLSFPSLILMIIWSGWDPMIEGKKPESLRKQGCKANHRGLAEGKAPGSSSCWSLFFAHFPAVRSFHCEFGHLFRMSE